MNLEMSWKRTLSFGLLALALVALTMSTVAEEEHAIKLVLNLDGDAINIETEDLEIGETRQFFSEDGKEVLLSRTEEGLALELDGEPIHLGVAGDIDLTVGDQAHRKIIVRKHGDCDGEDVDVHHLIDGDHDVDVHVLHLDPAQRLLDSGALDDLTEEQRQRILDALKSGHHGEAHRVIKIIDVDEHIEEDGGE